MFVPIDRVGILILGQEQDAYGGFFDLNQAFSGEITQLEMWESVLSNSAIQSLAKCEVETVQEDNRILVWGDLQDWSLEQVRLGHLDQTQTNFSIVYLEGG